MRIKKFIMIGLGVFIGILIISSFFAQQSAEKSPVEVSKMIVNEGKEQAAVGTTTKINTKKIQKPAPLLDDLVPFCEAFPEAVSMDAYTQVAPKKRRIVVPLASTYASEPTQAVKKDNQENDEYDAPEKEFNVMRPRSTFGLMQTVAPYRGGFNGSGHYPQRDHYGVDSAYHSSPSYSSSSHHSPQSRPSDHAREDVSVSTPSANAGVPQQVVAAPAASPSSPTNDLDSEYRRRNKKLVKDKLMESLSPAVNQENIENVAPMPEPNEIDQGVESEDQEEEAEEEEEGSSLGSMLSYVGKMVLAIAGPMAIREGLSYGWNWLKSWFTGDQPAAAAPGQGEADGGGGDVQDQQEQGLDPAVGQMEAEQGDPAAVPRRVAHQRAGLWGALRSLWNRFVGSDRVPAAADGGGAGDPAA